MDNVIDDYEDIINMTDGQAADILEKIHELIIYGGRMNGKTRLRMAYPVAMKKAITALRSTSYIMATAAGAGYEAGRETSNRKCRLILWHHMETCENCGSVMPMMNEYYRAKLKGCPYCLSEFVNAGTTYLKENEDG